MTCRNALREVVKNGRSQYLEETICIPIVEVCVLMLQEKLDLAAVEQHAAESLYSILNGTQILPRLCFAADCARDDDIAEHLINVQIYVSECNEAIYFQLLTMEKMDREPMRVNHGTIAMRLEGLFW